MAQISFTLPNESVDYTELFAVFRKIGLSTVTFSFLPSEEPPKELSESDENKEKIDPDGIPSDTYRWK